jgi:hypothetical protein
MKQFEKMGTNPKGRKFIKTADVIDAIGEGMRCCLVMWLT